MGKKSTIFNIFLKIQFWTKTKERFLMTEMQITISNFASH